MGFADSLARGGWHEKDVSHAEKLVGDDPARIKVLWFSGDGMCLFTKRLESGVFTWPQAVNRCLISERNLLKK